MHLDLPPKPAIIRPADRAPNQASVLPGMFPVLAAAPAGVSSVMFHASAGSGAASLTAPASIQAGDLLFFFDAARGLFAPPAAVVPSGFTVINNHGGSDTSAGLRVITSYKIATGAEAGASITGMSGVIFVEKGILVFRGNVPITSVLAGDPKGQITAGDPSVQLIASAGGTAPLIAFATYVAFNAVVDPRIMTPAKDAEYDCDEGGATWVAWKIFNTAPADVSVDMDDEDFSALQSCYLQIS